MKAQTMVHISSYYPPHLGGQENAVHSLVHQLTDAGYQVHVLTSIIGGAMQGSTTEMGVTVQRLWGIIFGHAPIMPGLPFALFRATRADSIVHLHVGQAFTPEIVWLVSKLRRFKYIVHLHIDFQPSGPVGVLLPLYKRFILRRVVQSAHSIIVLNRKTLRLVREVYGYKGRAQVMNNGIDDIFFMLDRPALPLQPPRTLRLLFVGRLSKQKNILALIEALKLTQRNVHLDIVGDGPERPAIEKAIAEAKLAHVTLHGRLERTDVMKFYKTCDALIMPSLYEAQPLVLLEAMAACVPIIGTSVIGVKDHIQDIGIIVEPTAEGLADGIEQYYRKYSSLPQMTKRGYTVTQGLRWSYTLKEYEALYEAVAGD